MYFRLMKETRIDQRKTFYAAQVIVSDRSDIVITGVVNPGHINGGSRITQTGDANLREWGRHPIIGNVCRKKPVQSFVHNFYGHSLRLENVELKI